MQKENKLSERTCPWIFFFFFLWKVLLTLLLHRDDYYFHTSELTFLRPDI